MNSAKNEKKPQKTHCRNKHAFPATSLKKWKLKMWKRSFGARPPSKSESWRCESEALVRGLPQNLKVEDVKTNLWCKTFLNNWRLKMWKRSFRASRPLKSESWSCRCNLKLWKWQAVSYSAEPIRKWSEHTRDRFATAAPVFMHFRMSAEWPNGWRDLFLNAQNPKR